MEHVSGSATEVVGLAAKVKRKILRIGKRIAKDLMLSWYFPHLYKKAARQPIVPGKVIFLENKENYISDSYKILYERLSRVPSLNLEFVTLGETRVRFKMYFRNCAAFIKQLATAQYLFLNDASNVVSCVPLRSETKVVQLWHGCGAFKKWGMSTADLKFGGTRKELLRHPFYKNLSMVTISSPEVKWAYDEAMVLEDQPDVVQPIGVSRTDGFFDFRRLARSRESVYRVVPEARSKKIILYAPTFRGRVARAQAPDQLDIRRMEETLGDEYLLLIKHHPFVRDTPPIDDDCKKFAFDVSGQLSVNDLLCVADVCITDYSSLVFEYSLFERPLIFFAYDKEDYDEWRGFYYDYEEMTPGPIFVDTDQIIDYISNIDTRFDKEEVAQFREKFMASCDGQATDRIIATVFGEEVLEESRSWLGGQDPLVSVIVPVYNAAVHLRECLDCIIGQTLDNIEIICVDDGSTDESPAILREYADADPRLTVISQQNEFAGTARNRGMQIARGKYLVFWDSDDYFEFDALEEMYRQSEKDQAEICVCGARQHFCDTGAIVHGSMYIVEQWIPEVPFSRATNEEGILNFTTMVVWNKMFLREFIERERIWFASSRSNNDVEFAVCALCTARAITIVRKDLVTYRRNQGSALTNNLEVTALDPVKTWLKTKEELVRRGVLPVESFSNRVATSLCYMLRNMRHFDGYMAVARYLTEEGLASVGVCPEDLRAPWQERFFRALAKDGAEESLMALMHETYLQELSSKAKIDKLREQVTDLKKLAEMAGKEGR